MHVEGRQEDAHLLPLPLGRDALLAGTGVHHLAVGRARARRRPARRRGRGCGRGRGRRRRRRRGGRPSTAAVRGRPSRRARAAGAAATMVAGAASLSMRGMGASLGCRAVTGAVLVRELRRSFATTTAVDGASLVGRRGHGHRAARPERRRQDHHRRVPRGPATAGCRVGAGARRRPVARGARPPGPGRGDAPGGRAADHQPAAAAAAPPRRAVRRAGAARRAGRPARDRGVRAHHGAADVRWAAPAGGAGRGPAPPPRRALPRRADRRARPARAARGLGPGAGRGGPRRVRRGDHALLRGGRAAGRPGRHHGRRAGSWPTGRSTRCAAAGRSRTSTSR